MDYYSRVSARVLYPATFGRADEPYPLCTARRHSRGVREACISLLAEEGTRRKTSRTPGVSLITSSIVMKRRRKPCAKWGTCKSIGYRGTRSHRLKRCRSLNTGPDLLNGVSSYVAYTANIQAHSPVSHEHREGSTRICRCGVSPERTAMEPPGGSSTMAPSTQTLRQRASASWVATWTSSTAS